jgi:SagB-type dehydrogenase family enzyme
VDPASVLEWETPTRAPVAELFHENSKLPERVIAPGGEAMPAESAAAELARGARQKSYLTAPKVHLPSPTRVGSDISMLLESRRSVREYGPEPVELGRLGQLLGWSYGVMNRDDEGVASGRPAPSAGALYPIEIYVCARNVSGLEDRAYHYDPGGHVLEALRMSASTSIVARASLYPEITTTASFMVIMTAVLQRTCAKYGERGYRFALLDCGHVAQNLQLVASAIGLGSVGLGGFIDDELNELLEVDGVNEAVVHTIAFGPIS